MDVNWAGAVIEELQSTTRSEPDLRELYDSFIEHAIRYARIRTDWSIGRSRPEPVREEIRSRAHDALISSCNILSRNMSKRGMDISWRAELGSDRKVIGDFACLIHAALGIRAR